MERAITTEELCRRLKPIFGKKIDQLYLKYTLTEGRREKEEIAQFIAVLYEKHLETTLLGEKILLVPPKENDVSGTYPLGMVTYADKELYPFCMRDQDLVRHICITGMSGSGKTNLAFLIISHLIKNNMPLIIFDWKKSFRPLLNLDKKMMIFTIGKKETSNMFRVNINRPPPGVDPTEWIGILCDLVSECFYTSYGVHKLLKESLDQAFKDFGVYKGSDNYPNWYHIKTRLEDRAAEMQKGRSHREAEWMESALRIAHSLTFGNFGDVVNTKKGTYVDVEDLFNMRTIFELASLDTSEKKFFCEYVLTYIYKLKKAKVNQKQPFNFSIMIDEAHNILLKEKPVFMRETVTEMIYREIREYGIGLICLDQHVSKLSETVVGNSATSIAFQQMLPQDVETVSMVMMIKDYKQYFTMLPVGVAIVKLAERYFNPFLIKVPLAEFKKTEYTDEQIVERMNKLARDLIRQKSFKESLKDDNLKKVVEGLNRLEHLRTEGRGDENPKEMTPEEYNSLVEYLSRNENVLEFLKLAQGKRMGTTELYTSLGLSTRKCDELKTDLQYRGLIKVEEERTPSGLRKFIVITPKGREICEYVTNLKSDSFNASKGDEPDAHDPEVSERGSTKPSLAKSQKRQSTSHSSNKPSIK